MMTNDAGEIIDRVGVGGIGMNVRPHIEAFQRERHVRRDFGGEHEFVTETFEVDAKHFRQF